MLKPLIQGLAVVWLLLFVASFMPLTITASDSSGGGLGRLAAFLTWQVLALVAAAAGALTTRFAIERGVVGIKLLGYLPLGISVFVVVSFIAIVGYRVFVLPLFAAA